MENFVLKGSTVAHKKKPCRFSAIEPLKNPNPKPVKAV